ncbi:MAG: HD-GYP domain-containing protein [Desulfitobacteriaceae bacterium]
MKLILSHVPANYITTDRQTERDLFDAQGRLLLAKGKVVTATIMELLLSRQLYLLENGFELKEADPKQSECAQKTFSTELYQRIVGSMQRIYSDARLVSTQSINETRDIVESIVCEIEQNGACINFNQFRTFDNNTYIHSVNVALLTALIALKSGFTGEYLRIITLGALLHDLGKLMIPLSILNKPSGLTESEFEIVKQHPLQGEYMLENVSVPSEVLSEISQHHERWKGQGYPRGLRNRGIHPFAQIVAVADVFDALTADRPYRKGFPPYHALEIVILGAGVDFSTEVVQNFKRSLVLYPENSIVTLNTKEVGKVIAIPCDYPTRPLVRVLFDENGKFVNEERVIDLLEDYTCFVNQVDF